MRHGSQSITSGLTFLAVLLFTSNMLAAQGPTNGVHVVDLASVLQLAGARSLDVQIAREKLAEASANSESSVWQFFPWIAPGVSYRRHDNLTQNVEGNIVDVHKEAYVVGPTLTAQVDLGNAIYNNLAARQLVNAAAEGLESRRALNLMQAAQGYFELVRADAAEGIAAEAVKITGSYLEQVQRAVEAGIAYRGDALRVQVQAERNQVALRRAEQQKRVASAWLVKVLHLDPEILLVPRRDELVPVSLFPTNVALGSILAQAQASRPELKEQKALVRAAEATRKGSVYGPLIPTLGAQVFAGGLGGGTDSADHRFGGSQDYQVGLSWRIGPGGLFDRSRTRLSESRLRTTSLEAKKLMDEISRQVVENHATLQSVAAQLSFAQNAATLAQESLRLSQERQTFAVGNVLEAIVAEQDLTRARLELATAIAEYNQAQYRLAQAIGGRNPLPQPDPTE